MTDDAMELKGRRRGDYRGRGPERFRKVGVASRVVRRREAVLMVLDAAYQRDAGGRAEVG